MVEKGTILVSVHQFVSARLMSEFIKHIQTVEASLTIKLNTMKKYSVSVSDKRTSITLEPMIWEILHEIADDQDCTVHELCTFIDSRKKEGANLSSAIRVFLLSYLFIHYKQG